MTTTIKQGLCWALATLHLNKEETTKHAEAPDDDCHKVKDVYQQEIKFSDTCEAKGEENQRPRFSRQEVADHCHGDSCWFVINNKIYDVTTFLRLHPGGDDIMLEYGGHDATTAFVEKGHSLDAIEMLQEYFMGDVIKEDWYPEVDFT